MHIDDSAAVRRPIQPLVAPPSRRRTGRGAALAVVAVAVSLISLAGCRAPTMTIDVYSDSHAFSPAMLEAPAGEPFALVYTNDEEWAEHNIAVYTREGGEAIAVSDSIVGPDAVKELVVPALAEGTYHVQCDIHPFMNAVLTVEAHEDDEG